MIEKLFSEKGRKWLFWVLYERFVRLMPYPNWRTFWLRLGGAHIGNNAFVHDVAFMNVYVNGFRNLWLGDRATIQMGCIIDLADKVTLSNDVTVGAGVSIFTHEDCGVKMGKPLGKYFPAKKGEVNLMTGSWIGARATILHGVTIGPCAVVGACSLVRENVPSWTIFGGVPAKFIKEVR